MDTKRFHLEELKADDAAGTVEAVFATLNAVDHDGDRILPGAIGTQDVILSAYGHSSWHGELPVGKGRVFERGDQAVFRGSFFMDTDAGEQTYRTVKNVDDLQEWSFALPEMDWQMVEEDGRHIREIKRVVIPEVSPVLLGAGVNTHTVSIKNGQLDEGGASGAQSQHGRGVNRPKRFVDHVDETVDTVESLVRRASKLKALRDDEGARVSGRATRRLKVLTEALHDAVAELDDLLIEPEDPSDELRAIAANLEAPPNGT